MFYIGPDDSLIAVPVSASGAAFQSGTPVALFKTPTNLAWDVSADGKRFLFPVASSDIAPAPFTVVQNWMSLLKK